MKGRRWQVVVWKGGGGRCWCGREEGAGGGEEGRQVVVGREGGG